MKQFYIFFENQQIGPLTFDDLKSRKITNETLVWFEGMEDWKKAAEIDELKVFFLSVPPPIPQSILAPPPIPKKEAIKIEKPLSIATNKFLGLKTSYLKFGIIGLVLIGGIYSFSSYQNNKSRQIHNYNTKLKEQENAINAQNERIAEQERIEQERIAIENKKLTEKRINEIINQLNIAHENLEKAKRQLNDATAFQLLRGRSERDNDIRLAEEEISIWKYEVEQLEKEMKKINPNWGADT